MNKKSEKVWLEHTLMNGRSDFGCLGSDIQARAAARADACNYLGPASLIDRGRREGPVILWSIECPKCSEPFRLDYTQSLTLGADGFVDLYNWPISIYSAWMMEEN